MDIDAIYAEFLKKEEALNAALARCEAEQAAGKTGFDAWRESNRLNQELQGIARALALAIDAAMGEITEGAA